MIAHLKIKNYALIQVLDIDFEQGFTTITGETGAGKSILLGAIGLVMGDRGDSSAILDNQQKCTIEAEFKIQKLGLQAQFESRDIEYSDHCIVRREWHPNGKTRSFINESQVTVTDLKWLGAQLLEIHSQHTGLLVTQNEEQLKLLDAFSGAEITLAKYRNTYHQVIELKHQIKLKTAELAKIQTDSDYHQFLLEELQSFAPVAEEENTLEREMTLLSQSSQLEMALLKVEAIMDGGQGSLLEQLNQLKSELKPFAGLSTHINDYFQRVTGMSLEAKELSRDLQNMAQSFESNPERLDSLNQRYSAMQLLFRKHNCNSSTELLNIQSALEKTHAGENQLSEEISTLISKLKDKTTEMNIEAAQLHQIRIAAKDNLAKLVVEQLQQLEMPYAQMELTMTALHDQFNENGNSQLSILFSANKGQQPMPIEKVASGGEISRLNFCLRTIIAELKQLPTLIYDEADTGVSGEVASRLGFLMRKQGQRQQILAITHLPQVAASGNNQLFVYKNNQADISETQIRSLDSQGRVHALAEMLSGKNPSEAAQLNAQHLLEIQSL